MTGVDDTKLILEFLKVNTSDRNVVVWGLWLSGVGLPEIARRFGVLQYPVSRHLSGQR
jgi:hypothetical protein